MRRQNRRRLMLELLACCGAMLAAYAWLAVLIDATSNGGRPHRLAFTVLAVVATVVAAGAGGLWLAARRLEAERDRGRLEALADTDARPLRRAGVQLPRCTSSSLSPCRGTGVHRPGCPHAIAGP